MTRGFVTSRLAHQFPLILLFLPQILLQALQHPFLLRTFPTKNQVYFLEPSSLGFRFQPTSNFMPNAIS